MKAKLYLFLFSHSLVLCQQPPHQSQIGKILQNAGITDKYSSCPCDPSIGAVTLSTLACYYCGVSIPVACGASACACTTAIICCGAATNMRAPRDYVEHTDFCGARICRAILNTIFKPAEQPKIEYRHPGCVNNKTI